MKRKKKMWLMGGFGNVLFQAFAASIIAERGHQIELMGFLTTKSLLTKFLKWSIHDNRLNNFFLKNINYKKKIGLLLLFKLFLKKLFFKHCFKNVFIFENEKNLRLNSVNYFGYFQSKKLIEGNIENFNSYCKLLNSLIINKYSTKFNPIDVCVHFRWSDSDWAKVNSKYYSVILKNLINYRKNTKVVVLTDDIDKANFFFKDLKNKKIKRNSPFEDFKSLMCASNLYIAPSTFSWWAAHLSKSATNVYMPKSLFKSLGYHGNASLTIL